MAIIKANYRARGTKTGGGTVKAMGRAAKYYTYREGADVAERAWQTADGRAVEYDEARELIRDGARTHGYSYRIVLSTKEADIGAEGYHAVLGDRFKDYLFVEHHNTDFPHAHVIAWTSKVLSRAELGAMRGQLLTLEQTQARELVSDQAKERNGGQDVQPSIREADQALDLWQAIGIPQAPERSRDHGPDLGY